jgi:glycosyltransferase involved in cell wall biosynthesis
MFRFCNSTMAAPDGQEGEPTAVARLELPGATRAVAYFLSRVSHMNPNVLLVGNFLAASLGVQSVGEELAVHLASSGYSVRTTSSQRRQVIRLIDMIHDVLRERRRYQVAQIDVFSGTAFVFAEVVSTLLRLLRKPYVLTLHGGDLPSFGRRWPRRVERLLQNATAVTAPSCYLREQMRGYRDDIRLLPNAVEVSAYPFHIREQPRPRMVWLRAFHRIYNPMLAPEVLARVAARSPTAQLTMIGRNKKDGSFEETKRAAEALRVQGRLALPGAVPKNAVPAWLAAADVFLNTTDSDNTPVSVVEAMAAGLCIVSTNVGGIPHLLEDGRDALLVPPHEPEAMAEAVRRILTEPGLAAALSRNARAKAEKLDWSVVLPQWDDLFTNLSRRKLGS